MNGERLAWKLERMSGVCRRGLMPWTHWQSSAFES